MGRSARFDFDFSRRRYDMCTKLKNCKHGLMAIVSTVALLASGTAANAQTGGPGEGIKVHGDWTIEVRNPDGSLVSRHEFKNALVPNGAGGLARLLGNTFDEPFEWTVAFGPASGENFCFVDKYACPREGNGLTVAVPESSPGVPTGAVVLSGTYSSPLARVIERVSTWMLPAGPLGAFRPINFTEKLLATPVSVAASQIVQFTVVFSFS
jgi:hypothetical protein